MVSVIRMAALKTDEAVRRTRRQVARDSLSNLDEAKAGVVGKFIATLSRTTCSRINLNYLGTQGKWNQRRRWLA